MNRTARLYNCARCHCQVFICSDCDRGNTYCNTDCAQQARQESLRRAGQKYQQTFRGRLANATRQRRLRERQRQKVTHQGSTPQAKTALLRSDPETSTKSRTGGNDRKGMDKKYSIHCHFCGDECDQLLRLDFIRFRPRRRHRHSGPSISYV